MSAGLRLDVGVLDGLERSMTQIRDTLSNAGGWARNDAKAAGDEQLAAVLVDFADDWRKTRNHMLQEIDKFTGWVVMTADSFRKMDEDLAASITPGSTGG